MNGQTPYRFTSFASNLAQGSAIASLMEDMGKALALRDSGNDLIMVGGGNPAHIPEMTAVWKERMKTLIDHEGEFEHTLSDYDPPGGRDSFRAAIAGYFASNYGMSLGPENILVTTGSQSACFLLINSLAGTRSDGSKGKVLLPLVPEYIGYVDQAVAEDSFVAVAPEIRNDGAHSFSYHVKRSAFEEALAREDVGMVLCSRPTNPSGNMMSHEELEYLHSRACERHVPLVIDNAYGLPFPGIVSKDEVFWWGRDSILSMSLSKFGLPSLRTGILVAPAGLIKVLETANAVLCLANNSLGQALSEGLFRDGSIDGLVSRFIAPFYRERARLAEVAIHEELASLRMPWRVHQSKGSFFSWISFDEMPFTGQVLYEKMLKRGVLLVPGERFFYGKIYGSDAEFEAHRSRCIRLNHAGDPLQFRTALQRIVAELNRS